MSETEIATRVGVRAEGARGRRLGRSRDWATDLREGAELLPLWRSMAVQDATRRYGNTVLGIAWHVIAFVLFVGLIAIVFGTGMPPGERAIYVAYLATGYLAWLFVSACVVEGAALFTANRDFVTGAALPLSVLAYRMSAKNLILLALNVPATLALTWWLGGSALADPLGAAVGLCVLIVFSIGAALGLGSVAALVPDLNHAIQALMRLAFFATPIIWRYDDVEGIRGVLVRYNPGTYLIEALRVPMVGEPAGSAVGGPLAVPIAVGIALLTLAGGVALFAAIRPRLAVSV